MESAGAAVPARVDTGRWSRAGALAWLRKLLAQPVTLGLLLALLFLFVALKGQSLHPSVLPDEYNYSRFSRLVPLAQSQLPDFLYLWLFGASRACGDNFLSCSRILNAVFLTGSVALCFLVARRYLDRLPALWVSALFGLGPLNIFASFYMPECFYFFMFWLLCWCLLGWSQVRVAPSRIAGAAMLIGLCSLIKPHALFFLPPVAVYLLFLRWRWAGRLQPADWLQVPLGLAAGALIVKWVLGWCLAGRNALTLFGTYTAVVDDLANQRASVELALQALPASLLGHLLALLLLYGVPTAMAVRVAAGRQPRPDDPARPDLLPVVVLTLGCLAVLLPLTAWNTSLVGHLPGESIERITSRHYSFAFPLLLIVCAAGAGETDRILGGAGRAIGILLSTATLILLVPGYFHLLPYPADCPDLNGMLKSPAGSTFPICVSLATLLLFSLRPDWGRRLFLYAVFPAFALIGSLTSERAVAHQSDAYLGEDQAGLFARSVLSLNGREHLLVMSRRRLVDTWSLFYVDAAGARGRVVPDGHPVLPQDVAADRDWVLVTDQVSLPDSLGFRYSLPGYALAWARPDCVIDFRGAGRPDLLIGEAGLSATDARGAMATGPKLRLDFRTPLPPRFWLRLRAQAFGDRIGQPLLVSAGGTAQSFRLSAESGERSLVIENPAQSHRLEIILPAAQTAAAGPAAHPPPTANPVGATPAAAAGRAHPPAVVSTPAPSGLRLEWLAIDGRVPAPGNP